MSKSYPFSTTTAKLVELIELREVFGAGTDEEPHRECRLWFTKAGHFVSIDDPHRPMSARYMSRKEECRPMILVLLSFIGCLTVVSVIAILDLRKERRTTAALRRERLEIHDKNMELAADKVRLSGENATLNRILNEQ